MGKGCIQEYGYKELVESHVDRSVTEVCHRNDEKGIKRQLQARIWNRLYHIYNVMEAIAQLPPPV